MEDLKNNHPPFLLHLLAILFVVSLLVNLAGIVQTIQSWNWLLAAGYFPHPIYTFFKSLLIALLSFAAALTLWLRLSFAPRLCQVTGILVFAWFWFDRLVLTRNPLPVRGHLFPLLVSVLLLAFVLISSWLLEPFMKGADRPSQDDHGE